MYHLDEYKLEAEGLKLMNSDDYKGALKCFQAIVDKNPNFEFGACYYDIACCFEELGELDKARENYLKAIEYNDEDTIRLGGYASFLYLYSTAEEALEWHIKYFKLEKHQGFNTEKALIAIKALSQRIGLSDEALNKLLSEA